LKLDGAKPTSIYQGKSEKAVAFSTLSLRRPASSRTGNTENVLEVVLTERHDIPEAKVVQSSILLTLCTIVRGSDGNQKEERGETTRVVHFYYAAWPDFGVPTELMTILNLAKIVEATNASSQPVSTPSSESKDRAFGKKTKNTVSALLLYFYFLMSTMIVA
jgi:protein tyrosine phosphatase